MNKKGRVLYFGKFGELYIENSKFEEQLVFIAPNKYGFSGYTLKSIEDQAKAAETAGRELRNVLESLKEIVDERAPAILGYEEFESEKTRREEERNKSQDIVLKDLKAYARDDGDAL